MKLQKQFYSPVDIAWLVVLRLCFGAIMMWEAYRYLSSDWIARYFIEPAFHFKYYGFSWVQPWPGDGMYIHFWVLGFLAFCIFAGAFYRITSILFLIGFSYVFFIDQATYLNHFYLVMIVAAVMCFMPAHKAYSFDAWVWPKWHSEIIPRWTLLAARLQVEVLLIYAGLVKINYDWLHLSPLKMWFAERTDLAIFGAVSGEIWFVMLSAYGVIILHVIGAPLLLVKRLRLYVFAFYCLFHMTNAYIFHIGIFPWMTIALTLIFFDPDWPRQVWRNFLKLLSSYSSQITFTPTSQQQSSSLLPSVKWQTNVLVSFLIVWFSYQILFPLRHYLYPGEVAWTEEGHRFAWRMKLRDKDGVARFTVIDPISGQVWNVNNRQLLTARQARKVRCRPDMLLQFAHHIGHVWTEKYGVASPIVKADVWCSLNYRPRVQLLDPNRDLMQVERNLWHSDWILPLPEELHYYTFSWWGADNG